MIELVTLLLNSMQLQLGGPPTGSVHPYVTNMLNAAFLVTGIAIALQFLYAVLRKKLTDIGKMNRIMKELTEWRKEYMDALKQQDKERIEKLKKRQQYTNKMQAEMMQMNFKPMIAFMIPMLLLWWTVLPAVFGNTVAVSPISLNLLGDWIPITCTKEMIKTDVTQISTELEAKVGEMKLGTEGGAVIALADEAEALVESGDYLGAREKLLQAYQELNDSLEQPVKERVPRCTAENEIFLWAWYAVASIAFSGMIMRVTKTNTSTGM